MTVSAGPSVAPSPRQLRSCLARFPTGVTVVSYACDGEQRGATVNAFTSVSLDPPLVLVSLARTTRTCARLDQGPFAVNVLRADQIDLALQFAGRPRAGVRTRWHRAGEDGCAPQLEGAVAVFQCRPWRTYDGGDHVLHLGEVVTAEQYPGEPLLFTDGLFSMVGLPLFDSPRVVAGDDVSADPWLAHVCRLHDGADVA